MSILQKHCYPLLICVVAANLALYPENSPAGEQCLPPPTTDAQCLECHQELIDQELLKPYIHQPFLEKKCILCHLGGELLAQEKTAYKSGENISWLAESPVPSVEHWFPIPKQQLVGDIHLDIMVPERDLYRSVIEAPDYSALPERPLDRTPPRLSDIKVVSIDKSVLLSATISWTTDELADTRIAYGAGKPETTIYIGEMSRAHQIILGGLREMTEYQFQVGSADYLGNLAQGGIATFSTSAADQPANQEFAARTKKELTWDREIFQDSSAGVILLKITTSVPTKIAVGILTASNQEQSPAPAADGRRKPCRHQLKTALETTITICQPCHADYVTSSNSHPLQVGPKAGMVFPREFFVLANGGINCMTCHSAHSSVYPNRLVKSGKEELCRSCHTEK